MKATRAVENSDGDLAGVLRKGLQALGLEVRCQEGLLVYAEELLRWNRRVNLTAITQPGEVAEKHLVDSLAILPEVGHAHTLLDLGSGAGLPGIPLALARPELHVTMAEAVGKKVAFLKAAIAKLELVGRVCAFHTRAEGAPETEGLPRCEVVTARALLEPEGLVSLARHYLKPGGRVVVMLGQTPGAEVLARAGSTAGMVLAHLREYRLPSSGAARAVATYV